MADSTFRSTDIQDFVRAQLGLQFQLHFTKTNVRLVDEGSFEFDPVSESGALIGGISTNSGMTMPGSNRKRRKATAKLNKIRFAQTLCSFSEPMPSADSYPYR
jgi:hypothetical protein